MQHHRQGPDRGARPGVEPERGEINLPLGTDPADRRRRIVRPDGAPSATVYERLTYIDVGPLGRSLVRCRLVTGRRHQIRVHLAARGWPIVGDSVYGEPLEGFPRHALHAQHIVLTHPVSKRPIWIASEVPEEIVALYPNSDTVLG